jgi:maltokinase
LIASDVLAKALIDYLPRQRWFAGPDDTVPAADDLVVSVLDVIRRDWPALLRAEVLVGGERYQLFVALRPSGEPAPFLHGHPDLTLGELDTDAGPAYGYDALVDPELPAALARNIAPGEAVSRSRLVPGEQSNTSVVLDERLFLKVFRRLHEGSNPEAEITRALADRGFTHIAALVAQWRRGSTDLAVLQRYLSGVDGWAMASTSLRDLFGVSETQPIPIITADEPVPEPVDPSAAGGDFSGEAERLGEMTAELHVALADLFGRSRGDGAVWADSMDELLNRTTHADMDRDAVRSRIEALRWVDDAGPAIRVHGDYHLAQVMRTDAGWHVLDFEGEPARPLDVRRAPTSALKDVAGMLRSLHYASMVAMIERDEGGPGGRLHVADHAADAAAWEQRNRRAFLDGYLPMARAGGVVPADEASTATVLAAFETDKAVYELAYEQAHRPDWIRIPLTALRRPTSN